VSRIAFLLLLVVALAHGCYQLLADWGLGGVSSPQWWFYILRGIEGTVLFGLCAWRWRREPGMLLVCIWGALEELQTAGCGYVGALKHIAPLHDGQTLCSALTGLPPYTLPLVLAALLASLQKPRR
jgi:hypothetical protein